MTEPSVPPAGSALRSITRTPDSLKTSMSPSLVARASSAPAQNFFCASGSLVYRCRWPIATPDAFGTASCASSATDRPNSRIANFIQFTELTAYRKRYNLLVLDPGFGTEADMAEENPGAASGILGMFNAFVDPAGLARA